MAETYDKIIVTNFSMLQKKYGAGLSRIEDAIKDWITADAARGLTTVAIGLDVVASMNKINASAVSKALDCCQNKEAIDAVYQAYSPDYLVILGSIDVVPHQDMKNPLYGLGPGDDPDQFAYGDLPYACDAPYSQDISDFKGPTRIVSRLPDQTGATDPKALVDQISSIINHKARPRKDYNDYHAVSAACWQNSTRQSARNMFGADSDVQLVPPKGRPWTPPRLERLVHFYNCHGSLSDPQYYGQPANGAAQYPPALHSGDLNGQIKPGTIVTAECCYGGELYKTTALVPDAPTCNRYLEAGAIGMWASTTIAYGPPSGNGAADLITQYFIINMLSGASLGRAALEARQNFIRTASPAGPVDLKTLAQFNIYGDAAVVAVETEAHAMAPKDIAASITEKAARVDRRLLLVRQGGALSSSEPDLIRDDNISSPLIADQLRSYAEANGIKVESVFSFRLRFPAGPFMTYALKKAESGSDGYVVAFAKEQDPPGSPIRSLKLLIGRVQSGLVVRVSTMVSR